MSATKKNTYAAAPTTTRGKPVHLGGDPKGKNWLYTCGNSVFIRNIKDPLQCDVYSEHQFQTTVARYSPSGFYIASADVSGAVRIWDTTQKEHILKAEFKIIAGPVLDLQWSDDSKRIIAVGDGKERFGAVFLWDTGSSVGEITGHSKTITSCDFKQTRPYRVATGSEDFLTCWFEGPPFKFKKSIKDHTRFVNCVRFSPDGNKLLTVSSDKTGILFDGKTGDPLSKLSTANAHSAGIYSAAWSPDSKQIITASADKTSKLWNAESGECVKTFNYSENPQVEDQQIGSLWVGDDVLTLSLGGEVSYLDLENPNKPKRVVRGHNKFITALAYDPKSNQLYSGSYDALILQWDVATGQAEAMVGKGHTNQINRIHIQGGNLITCAMDDTVRITPLGSRQYGESVSLESAPADIAVGRKDAQVVFAATTNSVVVIRGGKVVTKHAVKYQPTAIAVSIDETQIAVGGKDNNIYLYAISGDKLTEGAVLKGHRGALSSLTYSPDGQYLGSADLNREIFVWDLAKNEIKVQGWVFHNARVNSLNWSPDSLHLVSGSLDNSLYVWDVQQPQKRIAIKDAHHGGVNTCVWIDNNTIASAGQDCTIKTWTVTY
eukprot:TRINITY_DN682_c0_g1_i1.p1 TRINITY_DN682_c0_g1~~TRINITY_DN682_c0_g1_i1.p1  ORF type:complete len:604 (+),score=185.68 TRINITY_DN682_c0_g1_i1:158-1969(+)